ncbi:hypothetical protein CYLTODRAFT_493319 [Cylindrobasidium torrendii FP15055 ss-10]|uniref:PHD-type domain-containing protein n=1 Tax=Cylindrobasidium torrendii FP15055 ss-10 TaxID=1314674 RepID=A0A0D7B1Y9_9AGAR|nr:hypothetical protein CYLTODRAFT_493319 [Cylindrobasidium torrendii FP15055 ss-10]
MNNNIVRRKSAINAAESISNSAGSGRHKRKEHPIKDIPVAKVPRTSNSTASSSHSVYRRALTRPAFGVARITCTSNLPAANAKLYKLRPDMDGVRPTSAPVGSTSSSVMEDGSNSGSKPPTYSGNNGGDTNTMDMSPAVGGLKDIRASSLTSMSESPPSSPGLVKPPNRPHTDHRGTSAKPLSSSSPASHPKAQARKKFKNQKVCDECEQVIEPKQPWLTCNKCGVFFHPRCTGAKDLVLKAANDMAWSCAECKECEECNSSGDAVSMLFCDSCDSGWHMKCVKLSEPPAEDSAWYCVHCSPSRTPALQHTTGLTFKLPPSIKKEDTLGKGKSPSKQDESDVVVRIRIPALSKRSLDVSQTPSSSTAVSQSPQSPPGRATSPDSDMSISTASPKASSPMDALRSLSLEPLDADGEAAKLFTPEPTPAPSLPDITGGPSEDSPDDLSTPKPLDRSPTPVVPDVSTADTDTIRSITPQLPDGAAIASPDLTTSEQATILSNASLLGVDLLSSQATDIEPSTDPAPVPVKLSFKAPPSAPSHTTPPASKEIPSSDRPLLNIVVQDATKPSISDSEYRNLHRPRKLYQALDFSEKQPSSEEPKATPLPFSKPPSAAKVDSPPSPRHLDFSETKSASPCLEHRSYVVTQPTPSSSGTFESSRPDALGSADFSHKKGAPSELQPDQSHTAARPHQMANDSAVASPVADDELHIGALTPASRQPTPSQLGDMNSPTPGPSGATPPPPSSPLQDKEMPFAEQEDLPTMANDDVTSMGSLSESSPFAPPLSEQAAKAISELPKAPSRPSSTPPRPSTDLSSAGPSTQPAAQVVSFPIVPSNAVPISNSQTADKAKGSQLPLDDVDKQEFMAFVGQMWDRQRKRKLDASILSNKDRELGERVHAVTELQEKLQARKMLLQEEREKTEAAIGAMKKACWIELEMAKGENRTRELERGLRTGMRQKGLYEMETLRREQKSLFNRKATLARDTDEIKKLGQVIDEKAIVLTNLKLETEAKEKKKKDLENGLEERKNGLQRASQALSAMINLR